MMHKYVVFIVFILVTSCRSRKNNSRLDLDYSASAKEIIHKHIKQNQLDFQTLHIKGKTSYSLFAINLDIRIKKGEIIWISARTSLVGNIAKIKITPNDVSYYSNYTKEYFSGDYIFLSDWTGVDLDFKKIQNLLLGRALNDLNTEKLSLKIEESLYKLSTQKGDLYLAYFFEPEYFNMTRQLIEQPSERRKAIIRYSEYKVKDNVNIPYSIQIYFDQENNKNQFEVEYKTIDFNTDISFPYEIPNGYRKID